MCITVRTIYRGRSYRGRFYLSGFDETVITDGLWGAGTISPIVGLFEDWLTAIGTHGFTYGVRSGTLDGVVRPSAIVTTATAWESRSPAPTSQRRRVHRG